MIYLDNAATTRIDDEVLEAMMPYLTEDYGNPGGLYRLGYRAKKAVDIAREQVAGFFNCEPENIVFTSGGSEANSLALQRGAGNSWDLNPSLVTSNVEHDSVYKVQRMFGSKETIDVNVNGIVSPQYLGFFLDNYPFHVGMVSVMYVNNETGFVNPVEELAKVCADRSVLFHTDCVQAAGYHDLDMSKIKCDYATISSHKIHGPKGVGALYARYKSDILCPLIPGGGEQEFGLRGGTENVAGIVGFGKACEIAKEDLEQNRLIIDTCREHLLEGLKQNLDGVKWKLVNAEGKIVNLMIEGIEAESLVSALSIQGVCISAGSACRSHEMSPSRALKALGFSDEEARTAVRLSVSRMNTVSQMVSAAKIIGETVKAMR